MRLKLRHFYALGFGLVVVALLAAMGSGAPAWPARPVKFIVTLGPGSGVDIGARLFADRLAQRWGQPVVVEDALELTFSRALSVLPIASYIGTTGGTTPQARDCDCQ